MSMEVGLGTQNYNVQNSTETTKHQYIPKNDTVDSAEFTNGEKKEKATIGGKIAATFAAIIAGIAAFKNKGKIGEIATKFASRIKGNWTKATGWIKTNIPKAFKAVKDFGGKILKPFTSIFSKGANFAKETGTKLLNIFKRKV